MKSLLIVSASRASTWDAALSGGATAVILDLASATPADIEAVAALIVRRRSEPGKTRLFVRVHSLASGRVDHELDQIMPARPDVIVLPAVTSGIDVQHLAAKLAVHEAQQGHADNTTRLAAIIETPRAIFGISSIPGASHRLAALMFDEAAFAAAIAADRTATAVKLAGASVVIAAAAAGVPPLAILSGATDPEQACAQARREGFAGAVMFDAAGAAAASRAWGASAAEGVSMISPV